MKLTDRISLLEICDNEFPFGVGVEIGVAGGHFTRQIIATWKSIGRLHCVDPWIHFAEGYEDSCNLPADVQEERYQRFMLDYGSHPAVKTIRGMSVEVAKSFPQFSVDFVYLDANHSEAAVYADLQAWWNVVKMGGIIAGHDYLAGNGKGYGVKAAVDRFAKENGATVFHTTQEYCRMEGVYGDGWEGCSFAIRR